MKFKWLLFDFDNTLADSHQATEQGMQASFKHLDLVFNQEIYAIYQEINGKFWKAFEQGEIDAQTVAVRRFEVFLKELPPRQISPEAFNALYMKHLIEETNLYEGVYELLTQLGQYHRMSIITNGLKVAQRPRLKKTQIDHFFESIIVSEEIGHAKPSKEYFDIAFESIENPPPKDQCLVIGDSLNSDILGANNYGLKTCWINPKGLKADKEIQADFEIKAVRDLLDLIG